MKCIMVMFDSLNRRMLSPYGCDWTHTPNFARLAKHAVKFDNAYVGSMPCIPARRELHTGRPNFLHRQWGPLEPFDDSMPEMLKNAGVYSHLATDHLHYFYDGGGTYHTRFSSWEFFRGQAGDTWKGHAGDRKIPAHIVTPRRDFFGEQDWINRRHMPDEADHPQARTFAAGLDFIRQNHQHDRWFLQLETFDPHEPFFCDPKYKDIFADFYDRYRGRRFEWPPVRKVEETPGEVDYLRHEYAALLAMCDAYLGKVLAIMDELDLWKDTMLIVNTDHGFLLGEHDAWAKNWCPWYNENANVPLFIWDPRCGKKDESRLALVQTIDLAPTILEFFDVARTPDMLGKPLRETIAHDRKVREAGIFGSHGAQVSVTDGRHVYMRAPLQQEGQPLFDYTLMPTYMRDFFEPERLARATLAAPFTFTRNCQVLKIPMKRTYKGWEHPDRFKNLLFDLERDPGQLSPVNDPATEKRMVNLLVQCMRECDAPAEQYERLGLPT